MNENVVGLRGVANCLPPREADAEVVALLEDYLAQAKAGDVVGVVIGIVRPLHVGIGSQWAGSATGHDMMAAATALQSRVVSAWLSSVDL